LKIVFASHTNLGNPFVVGSHHLSRVLARNGHSVAHVSSPITPFHLLNARDPAVRLRFGQWRQGPHRDRVGAPWNIIPVSPLPWQIPLLVSGFSINPFYPAHHSVRHSLTRLGLGAPDLLLIDEPRFFGLEEVLAPRICIYRPTDRMAAHTGDARVGMAERILLRHCHGIVATSGVILEDLAPLRIPAKVLINGVDIEHFAPPPGKIDMFERPTCVYAGALDDRFGWIHLLHAARRHPDFDFLLAGPAPVRRLELPSNVSLLGVVPYDNLPALFHRCHAALLPLSEHPSNDGRSPMKLYEYLASNLPVVATSTRELERRSQSGVRLARSPEDFAQAVEDQIEAKLHDRENWTDLARPWSWDARAAELLEFATSLGA